MSWRSTSLFAVSKSTTPLKTEFSKRTIRRTASGEQYPLNGQRVIFAPQEVVGPYVCPTVGAYRLSALPSRSKSLAFVSFNARLKGLLGPVSRVVKKKKRHVMSLRSESPGTVAVGAICCWIKSGYEPQLQPSEEGTT
jgi:hypothetical protein